METNNCTKPQCFCDGSCQVLIKSEMNYNSEKPMESKTEEEIEKLADQFMCSGKTIGGGDSGWIRSAFIEGYKSASQQIAEKDKEIERLKMRKLAHQLFIGKVADILGIEKAQELLRDAKESLNKMI